MPKVLSEFGNIIGVAGSDIQYSTMPLYTDLPLGKVIQYVGPTTQDYTIGYFYRRTATGWENIDVQGIVERAQEADVAETANNLVLNPTPEQQADLNIWIES